MKAQEIVELSYREFVKLGEYPSSDEIFQTLERLMSQNLHREGHVQFCAVFSGLWAAIQVFQEDIKEVHWNCRGSEALHAVYKYGYQHRKNEVC